MRMKKLAVMALATALSVGSVMTASAAWLQEGSNWKYQNDDGTFQTGTWFRDVDGRWYHFDNNGIMQKGWFQDADGKWYFMAYNGVMQVGLIKVDSSVYFMNPSGDLFIGDKEVNGKVYNFGVNGTTNGQPNVPLTATFGGNGNQSLSGGGGSSSPSSSSSSKSKLKTVATVADLNALAKEGYTNLKYATNDGGAVTLSEVDDVDYSKVTLTVDAPNQSITNEITFKQVTIEAVKPNTWNENAGNKIVLNSDARIVNNSEGTVVNVAKANIQVKLEGDTATGLNVTVSGTTIIADVPIVATVSKPVTLVVNETSGSSVAVTEPVTVEVKSSNPTDSGKLDITTTAKAEIKTAIPATITASQEITLVVTHSAAASGTTVKSANNDADEAVAKTEIKNESSATVEVEIKNSDNTTAEKKPVEPEPTNTADKLVAEGIKAAVASADKSSYIGASIKEDTVNVTIKQPNAALIDALPTARTILNMFKSVDGVESITVDNKPVNNDQEMLEFARALYSGKTKLGEVDKTSYDVKVFYKGGVAPLTYTVNIK
ncbi:MAG: hypothetical protein SPI21_04610 [Hungatella hathewayi]|uniref:N-acetylmuramoyl-L-alanine amidase family protein n=1 Tax=Hungatella TaxID=1649459 RepID=UPI001FAC0E99|nr:MULTISPECIES: hypothetical protein [Hungatella]MCI7380902.1 hypothetical protein [Hungatella sp.]MDY6236057.1 hypothetical protein [Hungatella hathewayi]